MIKRSVSRSEANSSAILELDTFEYFKDVLAPSIRQKLKR